MTTSEIMQDLEGLQDLEDLEEEETGIEEEVVEEEVIINDDEPPLSSLSSPDVTPNVILFTVDMGNMLDQLKAMATVLGFPSFEKMTLAHQGKSYPELVAVANEKLIQDALFNQYGEQWEQDRLVEQQRVLDTFANHAMKGDVPLTESLLILRDAMYNVPSIDKDVPIIDGQPNIVKTQQYLFRELFTDDMVGKLHELHLQFINKVVDLFINTQVKMNKGKGKGNMNSSSKTDNDLYTTLLSTDGREYLLLANFSSVKIQSLIRTIVRKSTYFGNDTNAIITKDTNNIKNEQCSLVTINHTVKAPSYRQLWINVITLIMEMEHELFIILPSHKSMMSKRGRRYLIEKSNP